MNELESICLQKQYSYQKELRISTNKCPSTVEILDEFEGIGNNHTVIYERMVEIYGLPFFHEGTQKHFFCNLVIERRNGATCQGSITFNDYRKRDIPCLSERIKSEITDEVLERYLDTRRFYRFRNPFLLRGQNSRDRYGFGNTTGFGDCGNGKRYGYCSEYIFAGAYITSNSCYSPHLLHNFTYKPLLDDARMRMLIEIRGLVNGVYSLFPYEGKLVEHTQVKTESVSLLLVKKGKTKYVPISVSDKESTIYIAMKNYVAFREQLAEGCTFETRLRVNR